MATAGELAEYLGAKLEGDPLAQISNIASPGRASAQDLIYLESARHRAQAAGSAARCVLVLPEERLPGKTIIEVANPKFAFAKAASWLLTSPAVQSTIHATAILAPDVKLGADRIHRSVRGD